MGYYAAQKTSGHIFYNLISLYRKIFPVFTSPCQEPQKGLYRGGVGYLLIYLINMRTYLLVFNYPKQLNVSLSHQPLPLQHLTLLLIYSSSLNHFVKQEIWGYFYAVLWDMLSFICKCCEITLSSSRVLLYFCPVLMTLQFGLQTCFCLERRMLH